ncbi:peptidyl-prolyl cis-trans isomerase PASTICCINO1-like [Dioscorea cayenensis subsp. rotundata]|uniref:Peptidyl-prolyl cis-trans isomerase PASTICCINO1-like n=1 Tax=Dioscorea cayennensis subsp. rotundata TaxID=55577 RepID=A0AB40BPU6_DIOCR|nr:peptidyl-prolyl cis-trans isomerase PASTICCINO1-like [Dioscorea cayenensis subsp. rotundata]
MLDFYKAKVVSEDLVIVKKIFNEGQRWESPREAYEVTSWYLKGFEMAIGTLALALREKASILVSNAYLSKSPLLKQQKTLRMVNLKLNRFILFRCVCLLLTMLSFNPNCMNCHSRYGKKIFL